MQSTIRVCMVLMAMCISHVSLAQFKHSEVYGIFKFGIGMGMNNYTYFSNLDGNQADSPKNLQIELGSGLIPEIGIGLQLADMVYVEASVSYSNTQDFYDSKSGGQVYTQGYSFKRYAILLGGKYYVPVNEKLIMDFNGGFSYSLPQDLIVKMTGYTESIKYAGTNGLQLGFAANYVLGSVSFSGGLRYRFEGFEIKPNQQLPNDFEALNPNFNKISSAGIDVLFGLQYNF